MSAASSHFSTTLKAALAELNLTQQEFSRQVGVSVPLLTKIFRGVPIHRKSLHRLITFFLESDDPAKRKLASKLLIARQRDSVEELGLDDNILESLGLRPDLTSKRHRAIASLFDPIPSITLLALAKLGAASKKDDALRDSLLSLADMANNQGKLGLPPDFFRRSIGLPKEKSMSAIAGGSLGEILHDLRSEEL